MLDVKTEDNASLGRGWGVYKNTYCIACGHEWIAVAPVGTTG